jgi:hypothetical protein
MHIDRQCMRYIARTLHEIMQFVVGLESEMRHAIA